MRAWLLKLLSGSQLLLLLALYRLWREKARLSSRLKASRTALVDAEETRIAERKGRTSAEKAMRQALQERDESDGINFQFIGILRSCFAKRNGTPRQPALVPASRAYVTLTSDTNPRASLDALDTFSHVWIIFVFHENTNVAKALASKSKGSASSVCKAKVTPPRLGKKVGLFSTRTPHRPNAIGLSVARIERVENNTVFLSGIDLIDGTPILDIKPYLPFCDALPSAVVPAWIEHAPLCDASWDVRFSPEVLEEVDDVVASKRLMHYRDDVDGFLSVVQQVLLLDIRAGHQRAKMMQSSDKSFSCVIDSVEITFTVSDDVVVVTSVAGVE